MNIIILEADKKTYFSTLESWVGCGKKVYCTDKKGKPVIAVVSASATTISDYKPNINDERYLKILGSIEEVQ